MLVSTPCKWFINAWQGFIGATFWACMNTDRFVHLISMLGWIIQHVCLQRFIISNVGLLWPMYDPTCGAVSQPHSLVHSQNANPFQLIQVLEMPSNVSLTYPLNLGTLTHCLDLLLDTTVTAWWHIVQLVMPPDSCSQCASSLQIKLFTYPLLIKQIMYSKVGQFLLVQLWSAGKILRNG